MNMKEDQEIELELEEELTDWEDTLENRGETGEEYFIQEDYEDLILRSLKTEGELLDNSEIVQILDKLNNAPILLVAAKSSDQRIIEDLDKNMSLASETNKLNAENDDLVTVSTLNQQTLLIKDNDGHQKGECALRKTKKLNSKLEMRTLQCRVDQKNKIKIRAEQEL
ncbi:unnamed protein product [Blepharisma stoltei]|uniref:Uncharacterized protein n=1 Tax=Blepharisma stoltei TaxID=1481888 RepID=A0AAU9JC42_9CILI|nr:unnamed protein product [Blepharisma stoltei]